MFSVSNSAIDVDQLRRDMGEAQAGAFVAFEGWVRNHNEGHQVISLEYEVFHALAQNEAESILKECKAKYPVLSICCVPREGKLSVGDVAVFVGVVAAHRDEAFSACRFVIDEIKHRLPIWKKETYTDGSSGWVNCRADHACAASH